MATAQAGAARVAEIVKGISHVLDGAALARVQRSVGFACKDAALSAASADLGSDRAMSNFRGGKVRLGAGWDAIPNGVKINLRPAGLWVLAQDGRKSSGTIRPKRKQTSGGRQGVVRTPQGYRAVSHYKRSRGLKTITKATERVDRVAGRETDKAIQHELARVVR